MTRNALIACIGAVAMVPQAAHAATIWSAGPNDLAFTVLSGANSSLPVNQDRITNNVWITRNTTQGIFNIQRELSFTHLVSPADTQWAFSGIANPTFTYGSGAAAFSTLTFKPWETALGGSPFLISTITTHPGVVHLLTDDIYIDITFTSWGGNAGGFAYTRAVAPAVPEPASLVLLAIGGVLLSIGNRNLSSPRRNSAAQ